MDSSAHDEIVPSSRELEGDFRSGPLYRPDSRVERYGDGSEKRRRSLPTNALYKTEVIHPNRPWRNEVVRNVVDRRL